MPSSVAEVYMLMLGPTGVPVIGEAWALPFNLQIQLDEVNWKLTKKEHRQDETPPESEDEDEDDTAGGRPSLPRAENAPPFDGDQLIREVRDVQRSTRFSQVERDRRVRNLITRAVREHDRAREGVDGRNASGADGAGRAGGRNSADARETEELTFDFGKNADAATSQMLKLMVNKIVFPTVLVTVFHRSMHAPMTLLITYEDVRLKEYALECAGEDTMSDITEKWTATYKKMSFTYQNRPPLGLPYSIASGVALAATQGRIKEFSMEEREDD